MMPMTNEQAALLSIIRRSLWSNKEDMPAANWDQVEELARKQGVLSLLYLGVNRNIGVVPQERVRIWRGAMLAGVLQNEQMNADQQELLNHLREDSVRCSILKGTSAARFYPHPDARCLGDIDLLVDQTNLNQVEQILTKLQYRKVEHEHDFHISYARGTTTVEVHYSASEVPNKEGGSAAQKEMNDFLEHTHTVPLNDMVFPVLSDSHQALMQILHMERHMLTGGIGLRQLCDWSVFVANADIHHWVRYSVAMLERCGLLIYASVITRACVRYLGLVEECASWCLPVQDSLVDEFMQDVFSGGDMGKAEEDAANRLFTNRNALADEQHNVVKGLITTLNKLAYRNFPITKKYKVLLPFCWVYLPARYIVRSFLGLRPKKNVLSAVGASNKRYSLYKKLHLYEVK